jgi:acid phosphatase (class A)
MARVGLAALSVAAFAVGCASAGGEPPPPPAQTGTSAAQVRSALGAGYLPKGGAPNSLSLIPPPPEAGSAAQAKDDAAAKAAQAAQSGARWEHAILDADLTSPAAVQAFSCALDVDINQASTPKTYALMRRVLVDVGLSTYPTKTKYQRIRPFVATSTPSCTPKDEAFLRRDGSYPSGHSTIGWGWALVLTEAAPDRMDALLARGRAFGQSRVICNVHWLSDTEEGRVMAAATVARLHDQPEFRTDLAAARTEIAAARAAGRRPTRDCAKEAAALAGG